MSGGKASRQKGDRVERLIVKAHRDIGIKSERVPLSGAQAYQGNGEDVDVYVPGWSHEAPLCCQVKARVSAEKGGWGGVKKSLADADALFLKENGEPPLVVLPWATWEELMLLMRDADKARVTPMEAISADQVPGMRPAA